MLKIRLGCLILSAAAFIAADVEAQTPREPIASQGFPFLRQSAMAPQANSYIFDTFDSAFNMGFLSGRFGLQSEVSVNPGCVYDGTSVTGCGRANSSDPAGTVLQIVFGRLLPSSRNGGNPQFAGVYFQEPDRPDLQPGRGYDLTGALHVVFEGMSPTGGIEVTFSIGQQGNPASNEYFGTEWRTVSISVPPGSRNISNLLAISTDGDVASNGGILLLRKIRFDPVLDRQASVVGLPLSFLAQGGTPVSDERPSRVPIPIDQAIRNLAATPDVATALIALLHGGDQEMAAAKLIADALVYALHNDNHGLPIPPARGSRGLRDGYMGGEIELYNKQIPQDPLNPNQVGMQNDVRLPGFTLLPPASTLCGVSAFCLVQNGASGASNALAIIALIAASQEFEASALASDKQYLNAAREIGNWIFYVLRDPATDNFGGYWLGYPDQGLPPNAPLHSKATADNATIFAAFEALAHATASSDPQESKEWGDWAQIAAQFVANMYDSPTRSFFSGTIKVQDIAAAEGPGIIADGPVMGDDVVNVYDFIDAQILPVLAIAPAGIASFQQVDWEGVISWFVPTAKKLTAGGKTYQGFNLVQDPVDGPDGIGWQYTAEAVLAMRIADSVAGETTWSSMADGLMSQIQSAETAPFSVGGAITAATLQDQFASDGTPQPVAPYDQCISVPFQCIPARPGLAATAWAILAELKINPFADSQTFNK